VLGKEALEQLTALNSNCRKALRENDFQKLQALMELKKEIMKFLKNCSFSPEDLPLVQKVLADEEDLAKLVLHKKKALVEFMRVSNFH